VRDGRRDGLNGNTAADAGRKLMFTKTVFGLIGMALFTVFVGAVVVKLKEPALIVVVLAGIAMMVYDFIEFLREKD
jgi:hypothetical protein